MDDGEEDVDDSDGEVDVDGEVDNGEVDDGEVEVRDGGDACEEADVSNGTVSVDGDGMDNYTFGHNMMEENLEFVVKEDRSQELLWAVHTFSK